MNAIVKKIGLAALVSLVSQATALSVRQLNYDTSNPADKMQDLTPPLGNCYARNPAFYDVVYNNRARDQEETFKELETLKANPETRLDAMHFTLEIYPMYDMIDETLAAAQEILDERPGDIHALYIQSMYLHATDKKEDFTKADQQLYVSSPSRGRDLDRSIADVATRFAQPFKYALPEGFSANPDSSAVAIVIFGAPVNEDGTPSDILKARLDKALEVRANLTNAFFICSGGAVYTATPESIAMQNYLLEAGIPQSDIAVDTSARDTIGNAINVAAVLERERLNTVVLVTSDFHTHRAYLSLNGVIAGKGMQVSIVDVGAPQTDYVEEDGSLAARMIVEEQASYRDSSRAKGSYEYCDF